VSRARVRVGRVDMPGWQEAKRGEGRGQRGVRDGEGER
jgi:hypothetical protein